MTSKTHQNFNVGMYYIDQILLNLQIIFFTHNQIFSVFNNFRFVKSNNQKKNPLNNIANSTLKTRQTYNVNTTFIILWNIDKIYVFAKFSRCHAIHQHVDIMSEEKLLCLYRKLKTDCKPKEAVKYCNKSVCISSKYKKCRINDETTLRFQRWNNTEISTSRNHVEIMSIF